MINNASEILDGIRTENNKVLYYIYQNFYPKVESFILYSQGNIFDAQDIFQDAMVVIYNKSKVSGFVLSKPFEAYLFSISKFIWFKELKRRKKENSHRESYVGEDQFDSDIEVEYIKMEKKKLVMEHFSCLSPQCQRLLKLFYEKTELKEITRIMGYSSDQYTKNRRNYCKGLLITDIRKNPRFNELKNESFRENTVIPRW